MNIFLYGMQSSGASLTAFFLGQMPRSVCVFDVWNPVRLPSLDDAKETSDHVIAKCVVTTKIAVQDHIQAFRPDIKILVLRHPLHNYVSLSRKPWANESGAIDEKFCVIEEMFQRRSFFDHIIIYEDLAFRQEYFVSTLNDICIPIQSSYFSFPRSIHSIVAFNQTHSAWCRATYQRDWGHARLSGSAIRRRNLFKVPRAGLREHVVKLCPSVYDFMEDHYQKHVPLLQRTILAHAVNVARNVQRLVRKPQKPISHS